jgi:hypothetical protein
MNVPNLQWWQSNLPDLLWWQWFLCAGGAGLCAVIFMGMGTGSRHGNRTVTFVAVISALATFFCLLVGVFKLMQSGL